MDRRSLSAVSDITTIDEDWQSISDAAMEWLPEMQLFKKLSFYTKTLKVSVQSLTILQPRSFFVQSISDAAMEWLPEMCPELKDAVFVDARKITDIATESLAKCLELRRVAFERCSELITAEHLAKCMQLETVVFHAGENLTDAVAKHFPVLCDRIEIGLKATLIELGHHHLYHGTHEFAP